MTRLHFSFSKETARIATLTYKPLLFAGVLSALALSLMPRSAVAATSTATIAVSANVDAACSISATALAFGSYTPASNSDATGALTVNCTNSTVYNVGLNQGTTEGGSTTTRILAGPGAATLNYLLFQDSGRTTNWGDTVNTDTVSGTGTGGNQTITIYGRVPSGQSSPAAGTYTDTITATITY